MKKLLEFIFIMLLCVSCRAQSPIIPLWTFNTHLGDVNNAYYKDIEGFRDQFVGTWLLDDGTHYFKVTFAKKDMFYVTTVSGIGNSYYEDCLIGEYEYRLNRNTIVNTLNNLNVNHSIIFNYNLYNLAVKVPRMGNPICYDCAQNEYRMIMMFQEIPTRNPDWAARAEFVLRRVVENGVEKLKVVFYMVESSNGAPNDDLKGFSLPFGSYTLVKQ